MFGQGAGRVELHSFFSASLGITKQYNVYLPAGYDSSTERYPVVYFFRGHEREWFNPSEDGTRGGKSLKDIADNLIATNKIGKMILVGASTSSADNSVPALGVNMKSPLAATAGIGAGKFEDYLTKDLIQHIDSSYRTVADKAHRGVDGFSLGGYTSIMLAVKHPELYASAACYDGTHMWHNLDDPRAGGAGLDDGTWLTTSMFDQAFGKPRDTSVMMSYNTVDILLRADSTRLAQIKTVKFFIHAAAFDGNQGNIDRGRHVADNLLGKGILNGFGDIRLTASAIHNWSYADQHATASLVKHWKTFNDTTGGSTGVNEWQAPARKPKRLKLLQNFPNPFNPRTNVEFEIAEGIDDGNVLLEVFDSIGKSVATLFNGRATPGKYRTAFDGAGLASGTYYASLTMGTARELRTMMLLK